jgi:hypothetical protein
MGQEMNLGGLGDIFHFGAENTFSTSGVFCILIRMGYGAYLNQKVKLEMAMNAEHRRQ